MPLNDKQKKKLIKLKNLVEGGSLAITEHLFEVEEKVEEVEEKFDETVDKISATIDEKIPDLKKVLDQVKGKDGGDGKDGERGIKGDKGEKGDRGVNGTNGKDGRDGKDGKDGLDGRDADPQEVVKEVEKKLIEDLPKFGEKFRDGLELLKGNDRLDASAIKGLGKRELKLSDTIVNRALGIVDQRTSFLINKVSNIQTQVNNIPAQPSLDNLKLASAGITIDGGGSAITTGVKGYIVVPFAGTITGWTLLADQSGSIVIDCWKDTYANFPPLDADSIAGTELPTLSSATKNQDLSLTTWTTSVSAGDIIGFNVDSATTVTRVHLAILITKT